MGSSAEHWLDALAKTMAEPSLTRRGALRRFGVGVLAAMAGTVLPRGVRAYGLSRCVPGSGTVQCPPGTTCIAGLCLQPYQSSYCPPGSSYCGGRCIDTRFDVNNCGGCNVQCPFGVLCNYSACTIVETPAPAVALAPVCQASSSQSANGANPSVTVTGAGGVTITAQGNGGSGQMTLLQCQSNPGPAAPGGADKFFDLHVAAGSTFTSLTLTICATNNAFSWFSPANGWQPVNPTATINPANGCWTVAITNASSPAISDLSGTEFAIGPCTETACSVCLNGGLVPRCSNPNAPVGFPCCDPTEALAQGRCRPLGNGTAETDCKICIIGFLQDGDPTQGNLFVSCAADSKCCTSSGACVDQCPGCQTCGSAGQCVSCQSQLLCCAQGNGCLPGLVCPCCTSFDPVACTCTPCAQVGNQCCDSCRCVSECEGCNTCAPDPKTGVPTCQACAEVGQCCFTSAGGVEVCLAQCPPGCCDPSSGTCQLGTADTACGTSGTCIDCTAFGDTCLAGVCSRCGPSNPCSSGCCDSTGTCQTGTANTACGTSGTCIDCTAFGDTCLAGVCSGAPCDTPGPPGCNCLPSECACSGPIVSSVGCLCIPKTAIAQGFRCCPQGAQACCSGALGCGAPKVCCGGIVGGGFGSVECCDSAAHCCPEANGQGICCPDSSGGRDTACCRICSPPAQCTVFGVGVGICTFLPLQAGCSP